MKNWLYGFAYGIFFGASIAASVSIMVMKEHLDAFYTGLLTSWLAIAFFACLGALLLSRAVWALVGALHEYRLQKYPRTATTEVVRRNG